MKSCNHALHKTLTVDSCQGWVSNKYGRYFELFFFKWPDVLYTSWCRKPRHCFPWCYMHYIYPRIIFHPLTLILTSCTNQVLFWGGHQVWTDLAIVSLCPSYQKPCPRYRPHETWWQWAHQTPPCRHLLSFLPVKHGTMICSTVSRISGYWVFSSVKSSKSLCG